MSAAMASTSAADPATHQDSADIMPAFNAWRQMISSITGLGLSEEQKTLQNQAKSEKQQLAECRRCEQWRDEVLKDS